MVALLKLTIAFATGCISESDFVQDLIINSSSNARR
jgi:hypothetical protein